MEQAFRTLVVAALPDLPSSRINWGEHPQDEGRPYVVMHLISMNEGATMQGPDGLERGRVQVDCYAPTFGEARAIGHVVKDALGFHRGGGFRGIIFDGMRQTREGGDNRRDVGGNAGEAIYRMSLDFLTSWRPNHG